MLLAALALTIPHALAGEAELQACCAAVGASGCVPRVAVVGEGSKVQPGASGTEVVGAWQLACGGPAIFDAVYRRTVDHTPRQGEVLDSLSPVASHCLQQACEVPPGGCLQTERDGTLSVLGCQDGLPLGAAALGGTPTRRMKKPVVVVVARRPLVVDAQPPAGAVPPPPPASAPTPGGAVASPSRTAEALVELTDRFPADPPNPCTARAQDLRVEARRHVDVGDEKRIARDWAASVREYRVALTMDVCNGYAWLGVGEVAASNERPDLAAHALLNATQMLPQHYGAFTSLGKAYEALGQVPLAAEAYRRALEISPSLMEARAGLARTAP
jgi:hypothetical protein